MLAVKGVIFGSRRPRQVTGGRRSGKSGLLTALKQYCSASSGRVLPYYAMMTAGAIGGYLLLDAMMPWMIRLMPGRTYQSRTVPADDPDKLRADAQRRRQLTLYLYQNYLSRGDGKIHWRQFPDIVDTVAHLAPNDDDFRDDLWYLFGWRDHNAYRSPIARFLDSTNGGLPAKLHNADLSGNVLYNSEQFHHYLGGSTGNDTWIPSHYQNGKLYAWLYELQELFEPKRGHYNFGDVRLFGVARKHRNDFLKYGRFTLADNIRAMLAGQADRYHMDPVPIHQPWRT